MSARLETTSVEVERFNLASGTDPKRGTGPNPIARYLGPPERATTALEAVERGGGRHK